MTTWISRYLFFVIGLTTSLAYAAPQQLDNYAQLVNALKNGHRVSSIIEFNKCLLTKGSEDGPLVLGLNFSDGFFLISKDPDNAKYFVSTLATNTLPDLNQGIYHRFKRIRVYEDNTATVTAISDASASKTISTVEYNCEISQPNAESGIKLFDYDA